jgi:dUTPase
LTQKPQKRIAKAIKVQSLIHKEIKNDDRKEKARNGGGYGSNGVK